MLRPFSPVVISRLMIENQRGVGSLSLCLLSYLWCHTTLHPLLLPASCQRCKAVLVKYPIGFDFQLFGFVLLDIQKYFLCGCVYGYRQPSDSVPSLTLTAMVCLLTPHVLSNVKLIQIRVFILKYLVHVIIRINRVSGLFLVQDSSIVDLSRQK